MVNQFKGLAFAGVIFFSAHVSAEKALFLEQLRPLCGKAFVGELTTDVPTPSPSFAGKKVVMKVAKCSPNKIEIPLFVGDDLSRTWVLENTENGLHFYHIHRHEDGKEDSVSRYGGYASEQYQEVAHFPADKVTKAMFAKQGLPDSIDNTWQMYLYPTKFSYRLVRPFRIFQVDFDLTKPIEEARNPW